MIFNSSYTIMSYEKTEEIIALYAIGGSTRESMI